MIRFDFSGGVLQDTADLRRKIREQLDDNCRNLSGFAWERVAK